MQHRKGFPVSKKIKNDQKMTVLWGVLCMGTNQHINKSSESMPINKYLAQSALGRNT